MHVDLHWDDADTSEFMNLQAAVLPKMIMPDLIPGSFDTVVEKPWSLEKSIKDGRADPPLGWGAHAARPSGTISRICVVGWRSYGPVVVWIGTIIDLQRFTCSSVALAAGWSSTEKPWSASLVQCMLSMASSRTPQEPGIDHFFEANLSTVSESEADDKDFGSFLFPYDYDTPRRQA